MSGIAVQGHRDAGASRSTPRVARVEGRYRLGCRLHTEPTQPDEGLINEPVGPSYLTRAISSQVDRRIVMFNGVGLNLRYRNSQLLDQRECRLIKIDLGRSSTVVHFVHYRLRQITIF